MKMKQELKGSEIMPCSKVVSGIIAPFSPTSHIIKLCYGITADVKRWLLGKDLDARKDWWQRRRGRQRMRWLGSHHSLNGHESEQTPETVNNREDWHTAVHGIKVGCDLATNSKKHTNVSRGTQTTGNTEGTTFRQHYTLLSKWSWDSLITHPHIFFLYLSANFRRTSK